MSITAILGIAFLLIGTCATFLMLWLWGFPYDEATHTSSAPRSLMLLHRLLGYSFVTIYVVMMFLMVPRLWNYAGDLPARSVAHALVALGIGVTLVLKISILRFFPHFRQHLPVLGVSLMVMTWLMIGLPLFTLGWEWSLSRRAGSAESISRVKRAFVDVAGGGEEGWARLDVPGMLRAGRGTMHAECIRCHDLNKVLGKERTGPEWRKIVASMTRKARKFGPISESEEHQLAMYLIAARGRDAGAETVSPGIPVRNEPKSAVADAETKGPADAPPPAVAAAGPSGGGAAIPDVSPQVLSLLQGRCMSCHVGGDAPEGLRLNSLEGALAGSDGGAVIVPGDPDGSELVRRIRGESLPRMPMDGPPYLSEGEIGLVEEWVRWLAVSKSPVASGAPSGGMGAPAGSAAVPVASAPAPTPDAPPAAGEGFVRYSHVRSILGQNCVRCHAPQGRMGAAPKGLVLTQLELALSTGERPVIVPGNPGASLLLRHAEGLESPRMPFDGPPFLDAGELDLLRRWIAEGARDAAGNPSPVPVGREVRLRGRFAAPSSVDGVRFLTHAGTEFRDARDGGVVEVRGTVRPDGSLVADRVRGR